LRRTQRRQPLRRAPWRLRLAQQRRPRAATRARARAAHATTGDTAAPRTEQATQDAPAELDDDNAHDAERKKRGSRGKNRGKPKRRDAFRPDQGDVCGVDDSLGLAQYTELLHKTARSEDWRAVPERVRAALLKSTVGVRIADVIAIGNEPLARTLLDLGRILAKQADGLGSAPVMQENAALAALQRTQAALNMFKDPVKTKAFASLREGLHAARMPLAPDMSYVMASAVCAAQEHAPGPHTSWTVQGATMRTCRGQLSTQRNATNITVGFDEGAKINLEMQLHLHGGGAPAARGVGLGARGVDDAHAKNWC
jgi:hypothetical protein